MSIWQTRQWWKMLLKSWQAEEIFEIQGIHVEKRKIALKQFGLFVLWVEEGNIPYKKLQDLCEEQKCLFVQVETCNYQRPPACKAGTLYFQKWHYKKFITPYTAIIDLQKSKEEILANMKQKWRYNIKVAEKNDVTCKLVEKTIENIKSFYEIFTQTTSRDSFAWNSLEYYTQFLKNIPWAELILVYKNEEAIAGGIFVFDTEVSLYYYGASSNKYRNAMAPYLLQWHAITHAKSVGSHLYDFLWVASPDEKNSSLAWVTDFKKKLTTDIREISDSYIWVRNKFLYTLIMILRKIKNFS